MVEELRLRRYDRRDADAVWTLHERALRDAGTDPEDVPGTDDLRRIETAYLDSGGDFLVGFVPVRTETAGAERRVGDGLLVAMGGFVPSETGHAYERTVPGAAELHRMRVAPKHQRRGYGRRLLTRLEERATERGFDTLLATTARNQSAAVAFYRAEGYDPIGEGAEAGYRLVHFEKEL